MRESFSPQTKYRYKMLLMLQVFATLTVIETTFIRHRSVKYFHCPVAADGSENVTALDLSDFPALADRSRREGPGNPTPVINPLAGRAPYGKTVATRSVLQSNDFADIVVNIVYANC